MTIGHLAATIPADELKLWPAHSKEAAILMIEKHGLPDTIYSDALIWNRDGEAAIVDKHHGLISRASE